MASPSTPAPTGVRVVYAEGYAAFFIPAPDPQLSVITHCFFRRDLKFQLDQGYIGRAITSQLVYLLMNLFWIPGVFLIIIILWDAFEVMLLPAPIRRRVRVVLMFFRLTWKLWSGLAGLLPEGERRERLLGIYGPLSLVVLILTWIVGLISGFGLIDASVRGGNAIIPSLFQSLYFSGVTFFTIGYGDVIPLSSAMKMTTVVEAGCGLGFLALVIGYLPVLYQLFARREAHVILLDERAGSPPTATELLRRHAEGRSLDALEELLREWELWSAELLESHMSYPMLSYYRSQFPNQSWLAALASIMDSCALIMVGIEGMRTFQARMSFSVARLAIAELSRILGVEQVALGNSRLATEDFARMKNRLEEFGLQFVEADAELRLAQFRATYEPFLGGLAKYLMISLPGLVGAEEPLDNWENNTRGAMAKKLVEAAAVEPGTDEH